MGRLYTHDIQSNPFLNVSEENRFLVQLKSNQRERAMIHTFQWRNKLGPPLQSISQQETDGRTISNQVVNH